MMEENIDFSTGALVGFVAGSIMVLLLFSTSKQMTPAQSWVLYVEQREYHQRMLGGGE